MSEPLADILKARPRRFRPYPQYKDSGVEWLGEVPTHWTVAPLYARYEVALGKMLDAKRVSGENLRAYLRNVDVQWDRVNVEGLPEMDFGIADRARYALRPGDVLVCEGGEVGRAAIWRGQLDECYYQKAVHRLRAHSASDVPRFFYYVMHANAKVGRFVAGSNPNTIDHLTAVQLNRHRFAFAPPAEQRTIANFLDRETGKIDALVAKKERLIELLQEKRTALITRAVTKGLDPNVSMKDSGVEWLGEIPAHWEVKRAGLYFIAAISGGTPSRDNPEYWGGSMPWVTPKDMKRRVVDWSEDTITERALSDSRLVVIPPPAILIVVRGMILAHTFPVAVTTRPITINQDMKALLPPASGESRFLAYWFEGISRAILSHFVDEAAHGTKALRIDQWRMCPVLEPPKAEQSAIADSLDRQTVEIDTLAGKVREGIDGLNEFRTALISAAVTGKIDVREEAA